MKKESPPGDLPPCLIFIDKEGGWYHKGAEMVHREFIRLFYEHMEMDAEGRYVIHWQGERCYVDVEDTAFVVRRVSYLSGKAGHRGALILSLSDDSTEALAEETLVIGKENVLYCTVKKGAFPARFNRAAYYQLAEHVEEEGGQFYLSVEGRRHPITTGGTGDPASFS
jgi:hypothetical protein